MAAFLYGLLGGILAWVATTFFGQPLVAFIRLRDECAKALAKFRENDFEVRRMPEGMVV